METIKQLREICQPKNEHFVFRCWRLLSIYPTKFFIMVRLSPNKITILSLLSGLVGGFLFIKYFFVLGSLFFMAVALLDCCDGEVARYRRQPSKMGAWLDALTAHLLYPYFFLTLGVGLFFQTGQSVYLILGGLAAIAKLIERSIPQVPGITNNKDLLASKDVLIKNDRLSRLKEWSSFIAKGEIIYPLALVFASLDYEPFFLWFFTFYLLILSLAKIFLTARRIQLFS